MSLIVLPFSIQLPAGYSLPAGDTGTKNAATSGTAAASSTSPTSATPATGSANAEPVDVISISNAWAAGTFTARAGDAYRMSDLFKGGTPDGQTIAGYRVALGAAAYGGRLFLDTADGPEDVTRRTSFTADEFARLTYVAGTSGAQSLTAVAQIGTRQPDGSLIKEIDSEAVQITADVSGIRSVNAMGALSTQLSDIDPDANIAAIVQQAAIFGGWAGASRPGLQTGGNFTAQSGDAYRMSDLFKGGTSDGQTIAGYRVALGGASYGGRLILDTTDGPKDVTGRTSFTADEFARLSYVSGASGAQSLTVVAQVGTRQADGSLAKEIDSQAVQITADVTGMRSINAMNALSTQLSDTDPDANVAAIAQQAGIFSGWDGASRPSLQTDGNFTAQAGDAYRMSDLFRGSTSDGQTIAGFRLALGAAAFSGRLILDTADGPKDVTGQTSFTADEFARLTYVTGKSGAQSLTVVAQIGTRQPDGSLIKEVDSRALQITADVTGTRSVNAMNALSTLLSDTDPDADVADIAQQAGIFGGWTGASRPSLQTDGNFTAQAGDAYRMSDLFSGGASDGQTIAGYRVALGAAAYGGRLILDTADGPKDVTGQTSFTAVEFAKLTYVAGNSGAQSLIVSAQIGTRQPDGSLVKEIDSQAVQITADISGTRSINAMNALSTQLPGTDPDANVAAIAQQAGIFGGWAVASRPGLRTDGNFTAQSGDAYRMGDLFKGGTSDARTIAGYRVALGAAAYGGRLVLDTADGPKDVTGQTSFTADEFAKLTYVTGKSGAQSLTVAAQIGTRQPDGSLTKEIDSQAVQITANVTGTRSINAMNALSTQLSGTDPDANVAAIAQQAGIFGGWAGASRPSLETALNVDPALPLRDLQSANGSYLSAGASQSGADLSPFYAGAVGSSVSPGIFTIPGGQLATALLLLGGEGLAAFQQTGEVTAQAIAAYSATKDW